MKKFLILLLFPLLYLSACARQDFANLATYRLGCAKHDETACAKYLFLESWIDIKEESFTTNLDKQNWEYWKKRYINKLKTTQDAYVAIDTMLSSLDDPYTRFLNPQEVQDQNMSIISELTGIGVIVTSTDGKIVIENLIEGTPAEKAGLKNNDVILKIDDASISGYDIRKIANMIRGPIDTKVKLLILRAGKQYEYTITRKKITIKAIKSKMLKNDIAYIKISTFMSQSVSAEFLEALKNTEKSKAIIIDLRGNPGGLLQNATFISNLFLKKGTIVSIHKKGNKKEVIKAQKKLEQVNKKTIILTNDLSASAAEILAAALQENGAAIIVGEKTYGKGLIQKIMPLPLHTAMNVTIAKYLTPQGHDIHKNGIKPDYEVPLTVEDIRKGNDTQLNKAIDLLQQ